MIEPPLRGVAFLSGRTATITVLAVAALMVVVPTTVAGTLRSQSLPLVRRVAPFDAPAMASAAYEGVQRDFSADMAPFDFLAAQALRRDPTSSFAAISHGLIADLRGDKRTARRWFNYADRLSRRDLPTQLWFIEQHVQAGDISGALARYDLALRGTPSASTILYPTLASAASDPQVAVELNRMLRHRPNWGSSFVDHLIAQSNDPIAIVRVTNGVLNHDPVNGANQLTAIVAKLLAGGRYELAWSSYRAFGHQGARSETVRDGSFENATPVSAFEWDYAEDPSLLPERGLDAGKHVLYIPSNPNHDGDVARQLVRLGSGEWLLSAANGSTTQQPGDEPHLRVQCAGAQDEPLADLSFARSDASTSIGARFAAPASCTFAWISIAVRQPAEPTTGARSYVSNVSLRRATTTGRMTSPQG